MPQDTFFVSSGAKELNEESSGIQDIKIWKRTDKLKNTRRLLSSPAVKGFASVPFPSTSN